MVSFLQNCQIQSLTKITSFFFLDASSFYFSPFSGLKVKCLELPLSFVYSNKTEKLATFTRLREATGVQTLQQTESGTGKNLLFCFEGGCSHGLPTAPSWGPGQERAIDPMWLILIPCPATGPWATLVSLGLLTESTNTAQAQAAFLGYPFHGAQSEATSTFGLTVTEITNILPVVACRVMAKAQK